MRVFIYNNKSCKLMTLVNINANDVPNVGDKMLVEDVEYNVVGKTPNVDVNNRVVYFNLRVE